MRRGIKSRKPGLQKAWRVAFFLLLVYFLVIRLVVWHTVDNTNFNAASRSLDSTINTKVNRIDDQFEVYADTLYSGRGLFLVKSMPTRQDWTSFVDAQSITRRYPAIYGLAYVTSLSRGQVTSFTRQLNANRTVSETQPIEIFPQSNEAQPAVVTYIAPETNEQKTIGYDLMNSPARAAALQAARDRGIVQASAPVQLISRTSAKPPLGMLMVMPIYKPGQPVDTVAGRRAALQGYIVLTIHTKKLLDTAFGSSSNANAINTVVSSRGQTIYQGGPRLTGHYLSKTVNLNAAGQMWQIKFTAPASYGLSITAERAPRVIILSILPAVVLLGLLIYMSLSLNRLHQHHLEHHSGHSEHEH